MRKHINSEVKICFTDYSSLKGDDRDSGTASNPQCNPTELRLYGIHTNVPQIVTRSAARKAAVLAAKDLDFSKFFSLVSL